MTRNREGVLPRVREYQEGGSTKREWLSPVDTGLLPAPLSCATTASPSTRTTTPSLATSSSGKSVVRKDAILMSPETSVQRVGAIRRRQLPQRMMTLRGLSV